MQSTTKFRVYLLMHPHPPRQGDQYENVCELQGGYADFFEPLFAKVNEEAGKSIVFANGATFGGDDLRWLQRIISQARQQMATQGESWEVYGGYVQPKKGQRKHEIFSKVTQFQMKPLLDKIEAATRKAKLTGTYISFNFWGNGG